MKYQEFVNKIVGLECWHVTVGGFAAHTFSLEMGEKRKRKKAIPIKSKRNGTGALEGYASLLVICVWRLEKDEAVVGSSDSEAAQIFECLSKLSGDKIHQIVITGPAGDLTIKFYSGYIIKIFSEFFGNDPSFDMNWHLRVNDERLVAGLGCAKIQPR